jgi:putative spermidine/putrescine transport system permease protein
MAMAPSRKRIAGVQSGPWLLVMPALLLLVVFYLYPLVQILRVSFVEPVPGLGNYALLATSAPIQRILLTTLRIGALTTLISLLLAYAIAYALAHASDRRRRLMFLCVLVPFWISVLVRAFAWVALLRSQGLLNNTLVAMGLITQPLELLYNEIGVVIGMVHYMVPLAVLTLYGQMSGIDRRLVPAARGLGAGATAAFLRIYLPMSLPGIVAAAILVFVFSLGFYITPALLGGGKTLMAAEYISLMVKETLNWGLGTALASTLMLIVFALIAVLSRVVDLRQIFGSR